MDTASARPASPPLTRRVWGWAVAAMAVALLPLTPGLSNTRLFFIRDLSLYFWGRYLWLRRTWLSGEFPLWDPWIGGGQAAVPDGLHQLFLLPAALVRLLGSEVLGFNLWVLAPFPLMALGMWLFLSRRFSAAAAALGAVAFALCGPVYSTTNFPNMSWTVAFMPWIFLAAERVTAEPSWRRLAWLALAVGGQALAGEPVSQLGTLVLVSAYVPVVAADAAGPSWPARVRRSAWAAAAIVLGMALAAVQLFPMADAAAHSMRAKAFKTTLFWSLHPLALVETVAPHLFGDYYANQSLATIPWVPVLNSGREPFFFSLYVGVPLLALVCLGFISGGPRRWTTFWVTSGLLALLAAAGSYTPFYLAVMSWVPILSSFRFPAKYIVLAAFALACGAAAGWDALWRRETANGSTSTNTITNTNTGEAHGSASPRAALAGRCTATFVLVVLAGAAAATAACLYAATPMAFQLYALAKWLRSGNPVGAAEYMLKALPAHASVLLLLALTTLLLLRAGLASGRSAVIARFALMALVAGDLVVRAWPINPTFDARYLQEPAWLAMTKADPDARFYVGGKRDGTLDATDVESSRAFLNPPGLIGSASRAALSGQTAFYPSAWHGRELLSYDLAVLWPQTYLRATREFYEDSVPAERARFLDRTGVRYRVLPPEFAAGHSPLVPVPYYVESALYDFGPAVTPRVSVLPNARVVKSPDVQVHELFSPYWDRDTVLVTREPVAAGNPGAPATGPARVREEHANSLVVEASAPAAGGYLLVLDSWAPGWQVTVDGQPADLVQANGLFRAVRLVSGTHVVAFVYRPLPFVRGAWVSAAALLLVLALLAWPAALAAPAFAPSGASALASAVR